MKVAIIGNGWVGKAMQDLFPEAITYVRDIGKVTHIPGKGITSNKEEINQCDIAFICVPTPNMPEGYNTNGAFDDSDEGYPLHEGKLDTSAVEECIEWLETPLIVIRSTVNPGDCDRWEKQYGRNIVMAPEYLGETPSHPLLDERKRQFLVIGGKPENRRKLIDLYTTVYNSNITIRQVTNYEAEFIKLTENRAIAFKVMQMQELYDVCEKAGLDYYLIRDSVYGDDPRFNLWFSFIYPNNRGFHSSKCLKKDVPAWCAFAESLGYSPDITRLLIKKSKEWIQ